MGDGSLHVPYLLVFDTHTTCGYIKVTGLGGVKVTGLDGIVCWLLNVPATG